MSCNICFENFHSVEEIQENQEINQEEINQENQEINEGKNQEKIPENQGKNQEKVPETYVLECGHEYHLSCMKKYISHKRKNEKSTCPYCRQEFDIIKFEKINYDITVGNKVMVNSTKYKNAYGTVRGISAQMYKIELDDDGKDGNYGKDGKMIRVKKNNVKAL